MWACGRAFACCSTRAHVCIGGRCTPPSGQSGCELAPFQYTPTQPVVLKMGAQARKSSAPQNFLKLRLGLLPEQTPCQLHGLGGALRAILCVPYSDFRSLAHYIHARPPPLLSLWLIFSVSLMTSDGPLSCSPFHLAVHEQQASSARTPGRRAVWQPGGPQPAAGLCARGHPSLRALACMPWPDARPGPESHPSTSLQHIVLY